MNPMKTDLNRFRTSRNLTAGFLNPNGRQKIAQEQKTASELPPTFTWNIVDTLTKQDRDLKYFKDAMYEALAKVHETQNGSKLRIKVPTDIVDNISYSFARARMLNSDLAKRTESFFVEWPNQLLTVAVPTDFALKKPWTSQGNCKYAFYHKTDWANVPKILSEQLVRPADWTRDSDGVPQQFPCYGPFGMACEVNSVKAPLGHHPACQLSNRIFKIGKGQLNAGIIGFSNVPRWRNTRQVAMIKFKEALWLQEDPKTTTRQFPDLKSSQSHMWPLLRIFLTTSSSTIIGPRTRTLTQLLLRNNQMSPHRSLLTVLDILLQVKLMKRAQHTGLHLKVHDAEPATKPGDEYILKYSQMCQPNFYVQHGVRPGWCGQCLMSRHLPIKIICGFRLDSWRGAKPKTHHFLLFLPLFISPFRHLFSFLRQWLGAKPNTPSDDDEQSANTLTIFSDLLFGFLLSW